MTTKYADTERAWDVVVGACRNAGICGLDTETYGHDITESSPVERARVHVWSLSVYSESPSPLRHKHAVGVVLPACALNYPAVRDLLLDPGITKVAHNAPHDVHSLRNEGIEVAGWVDSLPRARVLLPEQERHGLKSVCRLVGRTLRTYEEVVTMDVDVGFAARRCICGTERCQRRSKGHERRDVTVYRRLPRPQPLETIVPGHPLFPGLVEYAAEDAIVALELWDYMNNMKEFTAPDPGWGPSGS